MIGPITASTRTSVVALSLFLSGPCVCLADCRVAPRWSRVRHVRSEVVHAAPGIPATPAKLPAVPRIPATARPGAEPPRPRHSGRRRQEVGHRLPADTSGQHRCATSRVPLSCSSTPYNTMKRGSSAHRECLASAAHTVSERTGCGGASDSAMDPLVGLPIPTISRPKTAANPQACGHHVRHTQRRMQQTDQQPHPDECAGTLGGTLAVSMMISSKAGWRFGRGKRIRRARPRRPGPRSDAIRSRWAAGTVAFVVSQRGRIPIDTPRWCTNLRD